MGLQKIIVLCAILLALGASGWYFIENNRTGDGAANLESQSAPRTREGDPDSFTGFGSVSELLGRGESLTCDYRVELETGITEGTVYIDGVQQRYRMHGTYSGLDGGGAFSAIMRDGMLYWWGDTLEGTYGMHMTLDAGDNAESMSAQYQQPATGGVSAEEEIAYDCDRWEVAEEQFVPPENIVFTDMDAMRGDVMRQMPEGMGPRTE